MPYIIGVSGYKNSGKTTLCGRLAELLAHDGLSVGYLKHTHEAVLPSGAKDTNRLSGVLSGAVLWGTDGFVEFHPDGAADLRGILSVAFAGRDIVIVEGGKHLAMPKIWLGNLKEEDAVCGIVARFDPPEAIKTMPCFFRGQEQKLADFVRSLWNKADRGPVELYADDRSIPVKAFVGEFIAGGIRGMLSALKKPPQAAEALRIYVKPKKAPVNPEKGLV
ncbi:MAG: molybdopterin-guanine dinucleotide biosynthesis protein B [Thermovirgaceae bacterium]